MSPVAINENLETMGLKQLQENLSDVVGTEKLFHDELYLLQWLKVAKFNVAKAEILLRNTIAWRREENINELSHQEFCPELKKELLVHYDGVSKTGIPIISTSCGLMDCRTLLEKHGREMFIRMWAHIFVKAENVSVIANRTKYINNNYENDSTLNADSAGVIAIIDLKDLPFRQIQSMTAIKVYLEIAQMFIHHFPGLAHHVYFINANRVATMLFKMLKPFLDIDMRVFDCNEAKWRAAILEDIDANQIRPPFGGTRPM